MPTVDAHQHFWDPDGPFDHGWLAGDLLPIRRRFAPSDLRPLLAAAGIDATVLVQVLNDPDETREFLRLAASTDFVAGVVGWVDLTDPQVGETLAELRARPDGRWLVGVRHLLHEEADDSWLLRPDVQRGLRAVAEQGLVYDLVGKTQHLPAMLETVRALPEGRFVLDHIGKPEIAARRLQPWADLMEGFAAERHHVWCKLSGMITEADWRGWQPADLAPFIAHALRVFGSDRCLFGSDWPVCLLAGTYAQVLDALRANLGSLDPQARPALFGGNAVEVYRLPDATQAA